MVASKIRGAGGLNPCITTKHSKLSVITVSPTTELDLEPKVKLSRDALDDWTREMVEWHFNPETGSPFWLEYSQKLDFDPRKDVRTYDDLDRFGFFQDEWLRGGPVRRWVPKGLGGKPVYVFETAVTTGVPK